MITIAGLSRLGPALHRPWLDRRVDAFLGDWYFPLSRAWATALETGGSIDRFREVLGFRQRPPFLAESLHRITELQARYTETDRVWDASFFGAGGKDLASIERRRQRSALAFMAGRGFLLPVRALNRLPAVRWSIASQEEVARAHAERLSAPGAAFMPREHSSEIQLSRRLELGERREYWLRFASPVQPLGGTVWAHVHEPTDVEDPPTLIFLHGIAVESEFVPDPADAIVSLVDRGIRVVKPEGLWHGRRRPAGYYGGEFVLARAPLGFLDYFHAAVLEVAELVRWSRSRSTAAVGVGGYSLGSLTSALVAGVAGNWPWEMRPDALLLIAHGADLARVALEGSLMRRIGLDDALTVAGWDPERFECWMPLAAPTGPPALDPARIVAVLGEADTLTHSPEAVAQMRAWGVPAENVFLRQRGHYTIAPALAFDREPLERFVSVLLQGRADAR